MDDKMRVFIDKLREKTERKEILWDESNFNSRQYRYRFNNGLINLGLYYSDSGFPYIALSLRNNDGRIVYSYDQLSESGDIESDGIDSKIVGELYKTVDKQIYNTDEVIDGILGELEE